MAAQFGAWSDVVWYRVPVARCLNGRVPRSRFRLQTDRLTIRMMSHDDVTAFTHYRKLPGVARYQEWPKPYTRDLAHELVDEMDELDGPTPNRWVQLAVDDGERLVGDVAVWLDAAGTFATIGYTLDPEFQGRGYAVEAVQAVIGWLFRHQGVHRIAATIDPRNLASSRVLERCGFEYVGTARSAALVDGEWTDDARFSLLEPDWDAWRSRPTGAPDRVELVEITAENVRRVGEIEVAFSQRRLVAPVPVSLAEALAPPTIRGETLRPWLRSIEADGDTVGFVMLSEPYDASPHPYLWRLVIARSHQRRGIGARVVAAIAAARAEVGATHLAVSYVPNGVGSPAGFYRKLGFVPTGEVEDDEVKATLDLSTA